MIQVQNKKKASADTQNNAIKPKGKWYSEDELNNEIIGAYKNFKESLREDKKRELLSNLNLAKEIAEKFYNALNSEREIKCRKIHLRVDSIISFEAIVIISEKAFLSDSFSKAYKIAFDICHKYQKDSFNFDFHFMPSSANINPKTLLSDGYWLSYQPIKVNESKT